MEKKSFQRLAAVIAGTQLFRGIGEEEIPVLLERLGAKENKFSKGEIILREGEPTERMGIVISGRAIIEHSDVWGNNALLGIVAPGAVFAEPYACIPGEPLLIRVVAAEDTEVLFLNAGRMLRTCTTACVFHERLIRNLLTVCAQKNLQLSRRILHTSAKTIRGRLMSYFSECVQKSGSYTFSLPYNRQQLADYLGVDRSAMCNELSKMQQAGLIRCEKSRITVNRSTDLLD